jgi:hypothetical protein
LLELCDRIDELLDAGQHHEAHRLTEQARNLFRRVYGVTAKCAGWGGLDPIETRVDSLIATGLPQSTFASCCRRA